MAEAALLDVDGMLVDTNYHHALAWYRALRQYDVVVPLWRLHRHVGMGGDKFVAAVAGAEVEERLGEALRSRWEELFDEHDGWVLGAGASRCRCGGGHRVRRGARGSTRRDAARLEVGGTR